MWGPIPFSVRGFMVCFPLPGLLLSFPPPFVLSELARNSKKGRKIRRCMFGTFFSSIFLGHF